MLKVLAGNIVFLGLEKRNVENLKKDLPMLIRLKELGLPDVVIAIVFGKESSVTTKPSGGPVVVVTVNDEEIHKLQTGLETIIGLKLPDFGELRIVVMYGDTKELIAADIEKKYGLKMPEIEPVNKKPM